MIKYSVGIDISKGSFHACISAIDITQKVVVKRSGTFSNNREGFKRLNLWLAAEHKFPNIPLVVVMEATGIYYEQCALFLYEQGYWVSVVLPNKAKKYIAALGIKTKNDTADAKALSRMGAEQALAKWEPMGSFFYELRELTRHNESLKTLHTSLFNQLEAATSGMYQSQEVIKELKKLIKAVETQIENSGNAIKFHLRSNSVIWQQVENIILIPGVGELTAAVILAETNGFLLFNNSSQLISYAGYDIVENQSGRHVGKTKISKKGNGHIRRILHMPALSVVTHKVPVFLNLFQRTYERHGIKMKSYTAVQKKLLTTVYALWKQGKPFDKNYQTSSNTSGDVKVAHSSRLIEQEIVTI